MTGAKYLILAGVVLILLGLMWHWKWFPLGNLPGDIVIDKGNTKFYFPLMTCIVISLLLSLISYLIRWLR